VKRVSIDEDGRHHTILPHQKQKTNNSLAVSFSTNVSSVLVQNKVECRVQ